MEYIESDETFLTILQNVSEIWMNLFIGQYIGLGPILVKKISKKILDIETLSIVHSIISSIILIYNVYSESTLFHIFVQIGSMLGLFECENIISLVKEKITNKKKKNQFLKSIIQFKQLKNIHEKFIKTWKIKEEFVENKQLADLIENYSQNQIKIHPFCYNQHFGIVFLSQKIKKVYVESSMNCENLSVSPVKLNTTQTKPYHIFQELIELMIRDQQKTKQLEKKNK